MKILTHVQPPIQISEPIEATQSLPSSYSSSFEPAEDFDDFVNTKTKGVRWHDEIEEQNLTKMAVLRSDMDVQLLRNNDIEKSIGIGSLAVTELLPSSIKIPSPQKTIITLEDALVFVDPTIIRPIRRTTAVEQKRRLIRRLRKRFPDPQSIFANDPESAIFNAGGITDPNGIHVFVDFSNIIIGFYNRLKAARGLHEKAYVSLHLISAGQVSVKQLASPTCRFRLCKANILSCRPNNRPCRITPWLSF